MSRRKQSHPKPLKVEMEEPEDSSPVINVTQISPASASSSSMSSITKMTPESPLSLNHSLVSSESTKTTSVTSASPITTTNNTSTIETSSKTSSNIILPLVNAPSSSSPSSSSVSVILETSQVKCTNSSDANLVASSSPPTQANNMTTTTVKLESSNSSNDANANKNSLHHKSTSPVNSTNAPVSSSTSSSTSTTVTTASLILPSASLLLSQPIFVAIKTSPLILVPCSFDSSTGCLSIAPSFNPQLLSSNGVSSDAKLEAICTSEPSPAVPLVVAKAALGSIGSNGRIENTTDDRLGDDRGSRSCSPVECQSVGGRPEVPTVASSAYSACNLLAQAASGKCGDSKKNEPPLKVGSNVNSSHSDRECGAKSAAAVLAAFASSNSHSSDSALPMLDSSNGCKGTTGHHQSITANPVNAATKVGDSLSPSTSSATSSSSSSSSSSSLPLDLSSRSMVQPPPVSNFNSIASLASSVNSYVNSLLPGHGLHNATALIHAMLHNANNPSPSSLANGHTNLSMMAALQAALAAECSDVNCSACCKGASEAASGPSLNGSSATGNPATIKRRRASNAIVITPGSSNFLSKPLHSDIESNTPSPTHCGSSPPAPSSMGHISSGSISSGTPASGTQSLLMPSQSQINQLVAAAVAQQQQTLNPASVGNSGSNSIGAITPVVVTGTTAGSGGLETATVKQGTHRCEDCNIVFYRQENYLVHKANYCASRRSSSDRGSSAGTGGGCTSSSHKDKSSVNGSSGTPSILATLSKSNSMLGLNVSPCDGGSSSCNRVNDRSSSQMSSGQESMDRAPSSSPEVSQDTIVTTNGASTTAPRSVNSSTPPLSPLPALVPPGSSVAAAASLAATITVNGPLVQYFCVACGIRFTSLDTLHAHQTFYCLKRSSIVAAAAAAAAGIQASPATATTSPKGSSVDTKHESTDAISDTSHPSTHPSSSSSNSTSLKSTTSTGSSCERPASSSSNNQQSFKCTICGYKGHTIRGMRTHVRMHSDQVQGVSEETFIQSMDPSIDINLLTSGSGSHSGGKMSGRRRTAAASNLATASPSASGKRKKGPPCLRC